MGRLWDYSNVVDVEVAWVCACASLMQEQEALRGIEAQRTIEANNYCHYKKRP